MNDAMFLAGKPFYRILVRCNERCDGDCMAPGPPSNVQEGFYGFEVAPGNFTKADAAKTVTDLRGLVSDHDYEVVEIKKSDDLEEEEAA